MRGLARGRATAFEISNAVPADYVDWLRIALISNFVTQGRGVAHVPPRKGSAEYLREFVSPHLRAGDCVVMNGTRHAWRNRSQSPCVIAVALIGVGGATGD